MFKNFELYIYNKNFELQEIIDFFSSLRWHRKYFEAGEFELHVPYDKKIARILKKDNILIREDAIENGIIESWQIKDDKNKVEVIIFGRFLSSILDRRITKKKLSFNGKVLDGERKILTEMTPFNNLEVRESNIDSNNIVFQCTYKNVYDYLNKLSKASGIAHRIVSDLKNKKFVYENYQGFDRTESQKENVRFEFSENNSNIEMAEYTFDSKVEKNYVLVGGAGEGENRVLVEVKNEDLSDLDLRETFVDAKDETFDESMELTEYQEILKTRGKENLINSTQAIEVTTYANEYKKGWDLGDIVDIKKESWGISMKKRIVEVEEIIENNNQRIIATFESPEVEELKEDEG